MEGVKDLSILFMAVAGSLVLGLIDGAEAIREWKYKKEHNKRKPGWWKPNTNF